MTHSVARHRARPFIGISIVSQADGKGAVIAPQSETAPSWEFAIDLGEQVPTRGLLVVHQTAPPTMGIVASKVLVGMENK
jgi:hypothetical protein